MSVRYLPFGVKGQIRLTGQDESFLKGYQAGHLAYMKDGRNLQYTDVQIIQFLIRALDDPEHSDGYQAGFIVGWLNSLGEHGVQEAPEAPAVVLDTEPTAQAEQRNQDGGTHAP